MTEKGSMVRIYEVKQQGQKSRLVKAASKAAAIRFCTEPMFEAEVPAPDRLVELVQQGVKVEDAAT